MMQLLTVESLYEDDGRRTEAEEIRVIILEAQVSPRAADAPSHCCPMCGARACAVSYSPAAAASHAQRAASSRFDGICRAGLRRAKPVDIYHSRGSRRSSGRQKAES